MSTVDIYLDAATRSNTRRSYAAAIEHFEVQWGGLLPASSESVARYLAEHAELLAASTLAQRLAALADWHRSHGFADPTKAQVVRKVLKGIRTLHPTRQRQARPLQLDQLKQVVAWLEQQIEQARALGQTARVLRHSRDRALVLLGFWRGFRGDELTRLRIEDVDAVAGQGLRCFLPWSKGDREALGRTYRVPALKELCPVEAYLAWIAASGLRAGPVFRAVDQWGNVGQEALHINSLIPLLRTLLDASGVAAAEQYSAHSLRRGFANWAASDGWDLKSLMEYVGWRDLKSAMRYMEARDPFAKLRAGGEGQELP